MTRYLVSTVTLRSPEYYIYSDFPKQDAQIPLLRDLRQLLAVKSKVGRDGEFASIGLHSDATR